MHSAFLEELKLEYWRRERAAESLTKKTKDLMVVSGIVAALIMALPGSIFNHAGLDLSIWLTFAVWLMIATIAQCVRLNRVEFQQTVLLGSHMTKGSMTDFDKIRTWTEATKEDYDEAIIDEYVKCIRSAERAIESKSTGLARCAATFLAGLLLLPAVMTVTTLASAIGI